MLAIPTLSSLLPSEARAQAITQKRFVALAFDGGRNYSQWYPSAAQEAGLKAVAGVPYMREMPMANLSGNISQLIGSQFDNIRSQLLLLRGLDVMGSPWIGHSHSTVLAGNLGTTNGGRPGNEPKLGPSVDYVMAKNAKSNPRLNDLNSYLNLGVIDRGDISYRYNDSTKTMTPVGRDFNPLTVFNRLFVNTTTPTPAISDRRKKVVDLVLENYKQVIASRKLASQEKILLQEHIDIVNDLSTSLTSTAPAANTCNKPNTPGGPASLNVPTTYDRVNNQNVEIMAAAIKCGIVNIGTIMLNYDNDDTVYSNLGVNEVYHYRVSHLDFVDMSFKVQQFYTGFFARLANLLNVEEPGTGTTYLNNSLLMLGSSMSNGYSHEYLDMPVLLAGSAGGKLRSGRYIDYSDRSRTQGWNDKYHPNLGRNYCALLVTLLQAMGLSQADYQQPNVAEGFGSDYLDTSYLKSNLLEPWRLDRKNPLPGVLT